MANHVNTGIDITGLKPETVQAMKDRLSGIETGSSVGAFFPDVEYTHEYFYENVGSKWCNLEDLDIDGDYCSMQLMSAWCYPQQFVEKLNEFILQYQKEFKVIARYEDEMPNFAGAEVYIDGELEDSREDDDEELMELIQEIDPRCFELLEKEMEGELTEEEEDELNDIRWEAMGAAISEVQSFVNDY